MLLLSLILVMVAACIAVVITDVMMLGPSMTRSRHDGAR